MKIINYLQDALQNLFYSKLRTLLALLGILVGTASVVAMVLGGELATQEALQQFQSLGTDLLAVSIASSNNDNPDASSRITTVDWHDAQHLTATVKQIQRAAPYTQQFLPLAYQGEPIGGIVLGVDNQFPSIVHLHLQEGRFVSQLDRYQFFAVIGHQLYEELKAINFEDPLGKPLQVGKNIFTIVGVVDEWPENSFVYANIDNAVMIPMMASTVLSKYTSVNNIIAQLVPNADIDETEKGITSIAATIMPEKNITFRSAKELINKMKNQSTILTLFLALIGSISLLVGGIGVMNIMLVSVIERKREIGIRLAVGATAKDIALLFLTESTVLSLIGGLLGVCLGILVAYVLAILWHWHFSFFFWPPIMGFSVSALVGIFFGFYPALQAARLDPIEALRSE